jgi:RNA polymerase sigma factor (sigma-70 family)
MAEALVSMTIEQALRACAEGDRAALQWIYRSEAPKMLGVAMRIVKRRSIAEDIVQDCFLRIWQAAASFDGALGNGRSWIYAIVRNRSLNVLRGESRSDLVDDMTPLVGASEAPSPEEVFMQVSENAALRRCLERLDEARRRIIVLAYTEGLSHGELAARCNVPLGTIKSWIRRSLGALRECLG